MKNVSVVIRGSATDGELLAAGPLTKQPGSLPYRIVLHRHGNSFAVHSEYFNQNLLDEGELLSNIYVYKSHLEYGHYFNENEFVKAVEKFSEKLALHARLYFPSLYREAA